MDSKPKHICFIIAMEGEAKPLIEHFRLRSIDPGWPDYLPFKAFQGKFRDIILSLVINGRDESHDIDNIGTQAATLNTFVALNHLKPDLVINTGTAGGFKEKGLKIGDIVIAQGKAWYHDRRIPIPKFKSFGLGGYPIQKQDTLIEKLGLIKGVISTGNSFDFHEIDKEIMEEINASIKDMEATAVAWVCDMAGIPLIIVKGVTDFVGLDQSGEEQFVQNFKLTITNLKTRLIQIIDFLSDL